MQPVSPLLSLPKEAFQVNLTKKTLAKILRWLLTAFKMSRHWLHFGLAFLHFASILEQLRPDQH